MTMLGPIATRILYEDDEVRIWDQRLEPGEATAAHHHANDYALIDVDMRSRCFRSKASRTRTGCPQKASCCL